MVGELEVVVDLYVELSNEYFEDTSTAIFIIFIPMVLFVPFFSISNYFSFICSDFQFFFRISKTMFLRKLLHFDMETLSGIFATKRVNTLLI